MVLRVFAWTLIILHIGHTGWAFSGAHGNKGPLPDPQIGKFRQENYDNLDRLKAGMTREQVSAVMGDRKEAQVYNLYEKAEILANPHRAETHAGKDKTLFEVRYYYAYQRKADNKITTDELCPVIFRDGKLEGWGYYEKEIGAIPAGP